MLPVSVEIALSPFLAKVSLNSERKEINVYVLSAAKKYHESKHYKKNANSVLKNVEISSSNSSTLIAWHDKNTRPSLIYFQIRNASRARRIAFLLHSFTFTRVSSILLYSTTVFSSQGAAGNKNNGSTYNTLLWSPVTNVHHIF